MYLMKHTIMNLKRNAQKNSILFLITIFILTICSLALLINETANTLIMEYQTRFGATVSIIPNAQRVLENTTSQVGEVIEAPPISNEEYQEFANSPYLKETMFVSSIYLDVPQYQAVGQSIALRNASELNTLKQETENLRIVAFSNRDLMNEFQKHQRYIDAGTIFQNEKECIISDAFAQLNKLEVGDEVALPLKEESDFYHLTISGIYTDTTTEQKSETIVTPKTNRRNEILMDYTTLQAYLKLSSMDASRVQISAQYYLKDPKDIELFKNELYEKGLSTQYDVFADQSGYEETVEPIMSIADITVNFIWIILVGGMFVLCVITMFMIRERKYEIGILRAIGLNKSKVVFMYIVENVLINFIALFISMIIALMVAQPLSDVMMNSQVSAIEAKYSNGSFGENVQEISKQESLALTEMPIQINVDALCKVTFTALLFSLCSSLVGIVYIIRLQPMKILSNRE